MSKIAIYFPGIGYHCDKPLLYYSRKIACELGYENDRNVSYTFQGGNIRGNSEKMKEAYEVLFAQAEDELADIAWNNYDSILFVSKSIGTIIAASYARKYGLEQVKHVLYTPLAQTFSYAPENAVGFLGTKDPWSDVDKIVQLSKKGNIPLTVYENCNHSLECDDTLKNLEILKDVMQKTREYCK
jgi:phosphoglycolate phosphatase